MKPPTDPQIALDFNPIKVRRVVSERVRDSEGKYATDLVAANDKIERITQERDIYKTNYLTVSKQLYELKRKENEKKEN